MTILDLFQRLLALVLLVCLTPLLLAISVFVYLRLGWPILYSQQRPGLYGRPFRLVKFRTMSNQRDVDGVLLGDGQRLTPFGQWLRRSSLDELPELFNILRGEMAFVGPRPLLMEYLPLYSPEQARRHNVKPGLTGWAQIQGRNAISWEQKFLLDVWYVDHRSLALDLRILFITIGAVLRREGINASDQVTMSHFKGS